MLEQGRGGQAERTKGQGAAAVGAHPPHRDHTAFTLGDSLSL